MLWLAVAFPELGLAVHTRAQPPGTPPRPLALVAEGRVHACNAEAAAAGVAPGLRTASAVALCPPLRFLEQQPAAEARLLRQLAEACIAVTPTVVLAPPCTVLLEVEGCLPLFRGPAGVLKQLRRALRPLGVAFQLAQAPTPKAALALVAGDLGAASLQLPMPHGLPECLPLLRQVPVAALPWEAPLQHKLESLQLRTLGELLALPRAALSKRLGTAATRYLAQLQGELPDPQTPLTVAEDFEATLLFLDGVSHAEGLRFPMKRLLDDLCRFLRQRQLACARFTWRFAHQDKSRQQLVIGSSRGEPQAGRFLQLTELKLEHFHISAPVEALTLQAREFEAQGDTRLTLLPEPGQEDEQALALLDRLRARLGTDACQAMQHASAWRPEQEQHLDGGDAAQGGKGAGTGGVGVGSGSNGMEAGRAGLRGEHDGSGRVGKAGAGRGPVPRAAPAGAGASAGASVDTGVGVGVGVGTLHDGPLCDGQPLPLMASPQRPFWLWPEPKPLRVMEGRLWWQGSFTLLTRPERITLPWWEDGDTRDYYLARHDNGGHYWVYFSRQQNEWFCQGLFG